MLIQHEYKVNQDVWYYKTDSLTVKRGIISDLEWDDEEECYMYTIAPEQMPGVVHIVPEHRIRDNEYEAHDLLRDYLEICMDGTSKTMDKYQKLRDREWYWIQAHHDEAPYA